MLWEEDLTLYQSLSLCEVSLMSNLLLDYCVINNLELKESQGEFISIECCNSVVAVMEFFM